jgi:hypothetical protein
LSTSTFEIHNFPILIIFKIFKIHNFDFQNPEFAQFSIRTEHF